MHTELVREQAATADRLGSRKDAFPCLRGVPLTLKALRKKDYSEDPQTLGEHLKKRRKELGLLQREAGQRMGVSAETVANWENGKPVKATRAELRNH